MLFLHNDSKDVHNQEIYLLLDFEEVGENDFLVSLAE